MKNSLKLQLTKDKETTVDIMGNETSGKVIIFSHGFGVDRTSKGKFTEIVEVLKDNYLCITFDYNQFDSEGNGYTPGFEEMAEALRTVHQIVTETFQPSELNLLTHSMGGIVAAYTNLPNIKKTLMLAPPPRLPYENFIKHFSAREGSELHFDKQSRLKRSWGAYTYIEPEFWADLKRFDLVKMYEDYAKQTDITIVQAKDDQVITDNYKAFENHPNIELITLPGGHDFGGKVRERLLELITNIFQ